MSNASRWRALAVCSAVFGAAYIAFTEPVKLGLDLEGGTQIVLEAQDTDTTEVDGDVASRTVEVLRRRVDALGVSEPMLQRSGDRRIIVELPGVADPDEAVDVIGRTAQLQFRAVLGVEPDAPDPDRPKRPAGNVFTAEGGERLRLGPPVITGESVGSASSRLVTELGAQWHVEVDFRGDGGGTWTELTADAACAAPGDPQRRVAIVLDREVISSPEISPEIACGQGITGGATSITGEFSKSEARELALLIRAGALPVPVEIVEQRTIGPTLGDAAVKASIQAAVIGAALTIIYMIAYYRVLGVLAAISLLVYGLLSYGCLVAIGATLTLPGIAGFVLAIGMAVDANVLVFERAKDEYEDGRPPRRAIVEGFRRAWTAIADSNATTLLAAGLLFFYASGAVRGFGITLSIGVVVSLFTALVVTRFLVDVVLQSQSLALRPRAMGLEVGHRLRGWLKAHRPNIIGRRRIWFTISALALVIAVFGLTTRGLTYGLEFSGGRLLEFSTDTPADLDALRGELADRGLPRAVVQESGDGNVAIRTASLDASEERSVLEAVREVGGDAREVRDEFVGPSIGDELRRKAVIALAIALSVQLVYLAIRFRWTYGTAAVLAMFHDVVILLGAFAWLGKELDGVFLAAVLTVIGYSINDSVVVFDRIREQRRLRRNDRLDDVANDACLDTIPRTINTGMGALFILVALYLLGGETLTDFALALIIGIGVGTYSSVFNAAPLLVVLERLSSESRAEPVRAAETPARRRPPMASPVVPAPVPKEAGTPTQTRTHRHSARSKRKRRRKGRRR
jgi:SecD/SecF fusion protein